MLVERSANVRWYAWFIKVTICSSLWLNNFCPGCGSRWHGCHRRPDEGVCLGPAQVRPGCARIRSRRSQENWPQVCRRLKGLFAEIIRLQIFFRSRFYSGTALLVTFCLFYVSIGFKILKDNWMTKVFQIAKAFYLVNACQFVNYGCKAYMG